MKSFVLKTIAALLGTAILSGGVFAATSSLRKSEAVDADLLAEGKETVASIKDMQAIPTDEALSGIPVYDEDDLIFGFHWLGKDMSPYSYTNTLPNSIAGMLMEYPGGAIRKLDDGRAYLVYDSDKGTRMFIFMDENIGYMASVGFPVVIGERLSFADFEGLKPGDTIDDVCGIDPIGELYRDYLERNGFTKTVLDSYSAHGRPYSSVHYLEDGLLIIEYSMDDSGDLIVSNIVFDEDRKVENVLGREVDYSICETDLP